MKIDLTLKNSHRRKIIKDNDYFAIESLKSKTEHRKSKIIVQKLTAVSQRLKV